MKKLLLIAILFSCFSCSAQKVSLAPLTKVIAYVQEKEGEVVRLQPSSEITYKVPDGDFALGKEYVFWLEVIDSGSGRIKRALVVRYAITTGQAQRDQAAASKSLSNRTILK